MAEVAVPAAVREWVELLHRATGVGPRVGRTGTRPPRWRLHLANDRVLLTMDFRQSHGRRWVWRGSTLSIDGRRVPVAANLEHFVRMFANPDEYERRQLPPPPLTAALQMRPQTQAPALVVESMRGLARRFGRAAECVLGMVGGDFWPVEVRLPHKRVVLRVHFQVWPDGTCHEVDQPPFLVMADGRDVTAEMGGRLEKVLAMMNPPAHHAAAATPAVDGPAGPARDNGVHTRRTTVLRL